MHSSSPGRLVRSASLGLVALLGLGACAGGVSGSAPSDSDPTARADGALRPRDPYAELPEDLALRQNVLVRRAIFDGNTVGSDVLSTALNVELASFGLPLHVNVQPVTPESPASAEAILDGELEPTSSGDIPTEPAEPAGDPAADDGPSCAFAEPMADAGSEMSCRFVVTRAVDTAFIDYVQELHDEPATDLAAEAPDPDEVSLWYEKATEFSIGHSAIHAVDALREVGACDREPTPQDSAFERGVDLGRDVMRDRVREREASTPRTRCDTDTAIVDPARDEALDDVDRVARENPLCPGFSASGRDAAARLARATDELRRGIERGIMERASIDSARLVREWVCTPPPPPNTDDGDDGGGGGGGWRPRGGDGGGDGGGGGGDPLVLDLDGNGIHVESMQLGPTFEFAGHGKVRAEWTSPGDAFVVLDRDGNGDIDATELFGDVTETPDGRIARDGFEALLHYDAPTQGGNGDGVVDVHDEIFPALGAWTDDDGDAEVDPGELRSLEDAGVVAIDVDRRTFRRSNGEEGEAADLIFDYVPVE
jgi:uncharacterized membrane protein YgcG